MAETREAKVPDIGDFHDVPVIEVLVKPGERVARDQGLVTLESDKATMEVPAPFAGIVREVKVKVGDNVSEGSVIAIVEADAAAETATPAKPRAASAETPPSPTGRGAGGEGPEPAQTAKAESAPREIEPSPGAARHHGALGQGRQTSPEGEGKAERHAPPIPFDADSIMPAKVPYASPAVRAFARELGVDLSHVTGSARGGRITKEDVQGFVKGVMSGARGPSPQTPLPGGEGLRLLPWPQIDFTKFGGIETRPLSRIKKLSGANLARNWAMIPHVTQFEDADITELEALRVALNREHEKEGIKVTLLAFLIKACVAALQKYPDLNASLDVTGENLLLKKYFHVGFAADTPNGLVVPVVRDADRKGVLEIAQETAALAKKAREGKLTPSEMQGGCFSISSLGGIGGTAFTPIVNAPEVAILGVSKSSIKPVWNGREFAPRLILPLSLSYDHRVIDGAAAARFATFLAQLLADMRRALL